MSLELPSLSTDQVATFVEFARQGSLRAAATALHVSEQGARNRILALEACLKFELYRKGQGPKRGETLTPRGRQFLPLAHAFLDRARALAEFSGAAATTREVHVAASQYLIRYLLIDAVRRFHAQSPTIRVRLSTHAEREIEQALLGDPEIAFGVAAPYEDSPELLYQHLFSMNWSLITPPRHPLARRKKLRLADIVPEPLILFERGSTGRQHVLAAFAERQLSPEIHMETTTTDIVVQMVEAGLGVALVPLLPGGAVTRGRRIAIRTIADPIRPIHSGILARRGETLSAAALEFLSFIRPIIPQRGRPGLSNYRPKC